MHRERPRTREESIQEGSDDLNRRGADVDRIDEEMLRISEPRATGFIGHHSEPQWLRNLGSLKSQIDGVDCKTTPASLPCKLPKRGNKATLREEEGSLAWRAPPRKNNILCIPESIFYRNDDENDSKIAMELYGMPPRDCRRSVQLLHVNSTCSMSSFTRSVRGYVNLCKAN